MQCLEGCAGGFTSSLSGTIVNVQLESLVASATFNVQWTMTVTDAAASGTLFKGAADGRYDTAASAVVSVAGREVNLSTLEPQYKMNVPVLVVGQGAVLTTSLPEDETAGNLVVIGEDATVTMQISVPKGVTSTATYRADFSDDTAGYNFVGAIVELTLGSDLAAAGGFPTAAICSSHAGGNRCTVDLGTITNSPGTNSGVAANAILAFTLTAQVGDGITPGSILTMKGSFLSDNIGIPLSTGDVDVQAANEPSVVVSGFSATRTADAGDSVDFGSGLRVALSDGSGPAYNLVATFTFGANMEPTDPSLLEACIDGACTMMTYDEVARTATSQALGEPFVSGQEMTLVLQTDVENAIAPYTDEANLLDMAYDSAPTNGKPFNAVQQSQIVATSYPTVAVAFGVSNVDYTDGSTVAIGEEIDLTITIQLPEGTSSFDVDVDFGTDGIVVTKPATVAFGSSITPVAFAPSVADGHMTVSLAAVLNTPDSSSGTAADRVAITLVCVPSSQKLPSSITSITKTVVAAVAFPGESTALSASADLDVVGPKLTVSLATVGLSGNPDAGDTVSFKAIVTHSSTVPVSAADAYVVSATFRLPPAFVIDASSATGSAPKSLPTTITPLPDGSGIQAEWAYFQRFTGSKLTVEFSALLQSSVTPGDILTGTADVEWTSVPTAQSSAAERAFTAGDPTFPSAKDTADVTINSPSVQIEAASGSITPGGHAVLGEDVPFTVVVTLPEGNVEQLSVAINLKVNTDYLTYQTAEVVSIGNQISGSALNPGDTPTSILDGVITFDFGDLSNAEDDAKTAADTIVVSITSIVKDFSASSTGFSGFFLAKQDMQVTAQVMFTGSASVPTIKSTEVIALWPAIPVQQNEDYLTPELVDAGDMVTCKPYIYMYTPPGYSITGLGLYNMKVTLVVSSLLVDVVVATPVSEQCPMIGTPTTVVDGSTGESIVEWTGQKIEAPGGQGCTQGLIPTVTGKVSDAIKHGDDISCVLSVEFQTLPDGNVNGAGATIANNNWRTKTISVPSPTTAYLVPISGTQSGYGIGEAATIKFKVAIPESTVDLLVKVRIPQISGEVVGRLVSLGVSAWSMPTGCTLVPDTAVTADSDEWDLDFGACNPSSSVDGEQNRFVEITVEFMAWDPGLSPQLTTHETVSPVLVPTGVGVEALAMFRTPGTASARAISTKTVSVILGAPALDISLKLLFAQEPLAAGQVVTFRITLAHSAGSAVSAQGMVVVAELTGVTNLQAASPPGDAATSNPTGTSLQWDLAAALGVVDTLELDFTAVVKQGTILGSDPITVDAEASYSSSPGTALNDQGLVRKVALPSTPFTLVQEAALDFGVTDSSDPYTLPHTSVAVDEKVEFSMVLVIPPAVSLVTAVFSVDGVDSGALTIRVLQVTSSGGIVQNTCNDDTRQTEGGEITYDFGTCTPITQGNITVIIEATVEEVEGNVQGKTYDARATLTHSDGSLGVTKDVVAPPLTITIIEPSPAWSLARAIPANTYIFSDSKIPFEYTAELTLLFGHKVVLLVDCQGPVTLDRFDVQLSGADSGVLSGVSTTQVSLASVKLTVGSLSATGNNPLTVDFSPVLISDAAPMSQVECSIAVDVWSSARVDAKDGRLTQLSKDFAAVPVWYLHVESSIVATDIAETDSTFEIAAGEAATIDVTFTFRGAGPLVLNLDLPEVVATAQVLATLKTSGGSPVVVAASAGAATGFTESPDCTLPCLYSPSIAPVGVGGSQWQFDFGTVSNLDAAASITFKDIFVATLQVTMANTQGHAAGESGIVAFTSTFDSARNNAASDKIRLVEPSASLSGDWSVAGGNQGVVIGSVVVVDVVLTAADTAVTSTAFDVSVVYPTQSVLDAPFVDLLQDSDGQQDATEVTFQRDTLVEGSTLPMRWSCGFSTALQAGATIQPTITASFSSAMDSFDGKKAYTVTHELSPITAADVSVSIASDGKEAVSNTVDGTIGEVLNFAVTVSIPFVSVPNFVVNMMFPDSFITVGDPTVTATGSLTVDLGTPTDSIGKIRLNSASTIVGIVGVVETIQINFGVKVLNDLNPHPTGNNLGDLKNVKVQVQYGSGSNIQAKEALLNVKIVEPRLEQTLSFVQGTGDAGDIVQLMHEIQQVEKDVASNENSSPAYNIMSKVTLPQHMTIESAALLKNDEDVDAPAFGVSVGVGALPTTGTLSFLNAFGALQWSKVVIVYQVRLDASVPGGTTLSAAADVLQYQTRPATETEAEARIYTSSSNPPLFTTTTAVIVSRGIVQTSLELVSRSGPYLHHSSTSVVVGEMVMLKFVVTLPEGIVDGLEISASLPRTVALNPPSKTEDAAQSDPNDNEGAESAVVMLEQGAKIVTLSAGGLFGLGNGALAINDVGTPSIMKGGKVSLNDVPSFVTSSDTFVQTATCGIVSNEWDNVVDGNDTLTFHFAAVILDTAVNENGRQVDVVVSGSGSQVNDSDAVLVLEIAEPVLEPTIESTILLLSPPVGVSTSYTLNASTLATHLEHVPSTYVQNKADQYLDGGSMLFDINVGHAAASSAPAEAVSVSVSVNSSYPTNYSAVVLWGNGTYSDEVDSTGGGFETFEMGTALFPAGLAVREGNLRAQVYAQLYLPSAPFDIEICTTAIVKYALPPGESGQPSRRSYTQATMHCQKSNPAPEAKSKVAAIALGITGTFGFLGLLAFGLLTARKKKRDRSSMQFTSISDEDIAAAKNLGLHPASKIDVENIVKEEEKERIKAEKLDVANEAFRQAIAFARMRYGKDASIDEEKLAMVFKLLELPMPYNQQIGPLMARKDEFMNQEVVPAREEEDEGGADALNTLIDEVVDFVVTTIPDVLLESIIDTYAKLKEQIEDHHEAMKAAGNMPGGGGDEDLYEVPVALIKEFESAENPYAEIRDDLINAEGDYMMPAGFEDDPDYVDPVAFCDDDGDEEEYAALDGDDVYMNRGGRASSAGTVLKRPPGDIYGLDEEDVYAVANLQSEETDGIEDAVLMSQGIYANRQDNGTYGLREPSSAPSHAASGEEDVYGIKRNSTTLGSADAAAGTGGGEGDTLRRVKEDEETLRRPESVYENRVDLSRVGQPGEESPYSDAAFATLRRSDQAAAAAAATASRNRNTLFVDPDQEDYGLGATVDVHPMTAAADLAKATADANAGFDVEESPYSAAAFATLDRPKSGGGGGGGSRTSATSAASTGANAARGSSQSEASSVRSTGSGTSRTSTVPGIAVNVEDDTEEVGGPQTGAVVYQTVGKGGPAGGRPESVVYSQVSRDDAGDEYANTAGAEEGVPDDGGLSGDGAQPTSVYKRASQAFLELPPDATLDRAASIRSNGSATSGVYAKVVPRQGRTQPSNVKAASVHNISPLRAESLPSTVSKGGSHRVSPPRRLPLRTYELQNGVPADIHDAILQAQNGGRTGDGPENGSSTEAPLSQLTRKPSKFIGDPPIDVLSESTTAVEADSIAVAPPVPLAGAPPAADEGSDGDDDELDLDNMNLSGVSEASPRRGSYSEPDQLEGPDYHLATVTASDGSLGGSGLLSAPSDSAGPGKGDGSQSPSMSASRRSFDGKTVKETLL